MNRNKKLTKTMAVAMAGAMLAQQGALPVFAEGNAAEIAKDETVYVKTDASGVAEEVIVSDWLKNPEGSETLEDNSDLSDIENVKGDETFSQEGDSLVWEAQGSDIYYQGTTTKELPVSVDIKYYLDGQEISPENLAGKSGHVKICYTYRNSSRSGDVYTPFTMVTGLVLPSENFSNIEVTNGKAISDGSNSVVVGIGLPGLYDSLKLADTEKLKDIEIPDSFEVEADVTDFKLTLAMTAATPLNLGELGLDDIEDMDDLKDSIDELTDAATQLVDGSGDLAEGVQTLKDSCQDLIDGMDAIDENMGKLNDGISTLNDSKGALVDGIDQLAGGIDQLNSKKGDLVSGVGQLAKGSTSLRKGASDLKKGSKTLSQSSKLLVSGAQELATGEGTKQLQAGSASLASGSKELASGAVQLKNGVDALASQVPAMQQGTAALAGGLNTLNDSVSAYTGQVSNVSQYFQGYLGGVSSYTGAVNQYVDTVNSVLGALGSAGQSSGTASADGAQSRTMESAQDTVELGAAQESAGTETVVKTVISDEAVQNMQSVLAKLQEVQGLINSATSPEDLIKLYASYNQYVGELNECISLMQGALNGVTQESVEVAAAPAGTETAAAQETVAVAAGAGDSAAAETVGLAAGQEGQIADLIKAGKDLQENGKKLTSANPQDNKAVYGITATLAELAPNGDEQAPNSGTKLVAGVASLAQGASALESGVNTLAANAPSLQNGVNALAAGAASVSTGASALDTGLGALISGAGTLSSGLSKFDAGVDALYGGTKSLYSGTKSLETGAQQLNSGAGALSSGIGQLAEGGSQLRSGAAALGDGVQELADGSSKLKDGTAELADGGSALDEGVDELLEGANALAEGMDEFNEEGIKKITDFLNEDVQDIVDRLEAVRDAGDAYKLFSDSGSDVNGTVKFIIETGSIE